ncbi:hypothetical protein [Kribbella sp. NPDC051620]|uniref:hypothetical protein n=1 Tax=Kribbella sp. NPDC051620 TaxID=3364120 RepID=UPI00379F422F
MRITLNRLPSWAAGLLTFVVTTAGMAGIATLDGESAGDALGSGAITGLFAGGAVAVAFWRKGDLFQQLFGDDNPPALRRPAARALRRTAPIPADPEVRAAAIRLADRQLALLGRWRIRSLIIWTVLLVGNVLGAVQGGSPWRFGLAALTLLLLVYAIYRPRALAARRRLLTQGFEEDRP